MAGQRLLRDDEADLVEVDLSSANHSHQTDFCTSYGHWQLLDTPVLNSTLPPIHHYTLAPGDGRKADWEASVQLCQPLLAEYYGTTVHFEQVGCSSLQHRRAPVDQESTGHFVQVTSGLRYMA